MAKKTLVLNKRQNVTPIRIINISDKLLKTQIADQSILFQFKNRKIWSICVYKDTCHAYCNIRQPFKATSEDPYYSQMMPNVLQQNNHQLFKRLMYVSTVIRLPDLLYAKVHITILQNYIYLFNCKLWYFLSYSIPFVN